MKKIFLPILLSCCLSYSAQAQLAGSGNALSFDGADDEADLGTFFTYQNFTVDMWVKPGATQMTYADIIDNNHTDFQNWVCQQDADNINQYYFGGSRSTGGIVSHFSLTANVWQHLTLVKTATAVEAYVNGILSESTPWSGTINFSDQFLRLGRWGNGGRNWNGSLDEVRIWNTPLSQSQIRERMCRKITASDPLFNNLVAYYNFDESTGDTVFDGTTNVFNGTLINGTARLTSGAAIGNASVYNYVSTGLPAASLGFNGEDNFGVAYTQDTYTGEAGTHVYVVNEKPNSQNGFMAVGNNDRYFGVFSVNLGAPAYTATYNYTGNPFVTAANETDISLFKRTDNSAINWPTANAIPNVIAHTLTATGQNTEYILGLPCETITANISAGGPLNFCQGSSVTLTSSAAASYLWNNGATTQSITVKNAGSYTVTVTNTPGCMATSTPVNVTTNLCFPQPVLQWQKKFGGSGNDQAYSIKPTSDGGYIVAGQSASADGDITSGHGGIDYWVTKLDASGNITWQKSYGGGKDDIAKSITQTTDGGFVIAGVSNSYDGDITDHGRTYYVDQEGNIFYYEYAGFEPWIVGINNAGIISWERTLHTSFVAHNSANYFETDATAVIQSSDGGILIGGNGIGIYSDDARDWFFGARITNLFGGFDQLFFKGGTVASIIETSVGYVITGTGAGDNNKGGTDAFVAAFDFNGVEKWEFGYGGSNDDKAYSIQQTIDGGYIVAGATSSIDGDLEGSGNHGAEDYWLLKLNSIGEVSWSKCFGGSGADMANAVQQMADGSFMVAGTSFSSDGQVTDHSSSNAQPDAWLIRVDHAGNFVWGKSYGGNDPDEANSLEKTADGGLIMAGASSSTIPGSINNGKDDYWILKFARPAVANGIPGDCTTFPPITINSSNNNQWVPITDNNGNAVAEIKANGNNLGVVTTSMFINNAAVREDATKRLYLDRNITITPEVQPSTPVDIRLYIKATEYEALKNAVNSNGQASGIDSINDISIYKVSGGCVPAVSTLSNPLATIAEIWETDYVFSASISSFSSFYFAGKAVCTAPVITQVCANPSTLWPPNHHMKDVTVNYKVRGDCQPVSTWLTVTSDEPVFGTGRGDRSPDWIIEDNHHLQLRAERAGHGNGRVYTITIHATDAAGNTGTQKTNVLVPHHWSSHHGNNWRDEDGHIDANGDYVDHELNCRVIPNPSNNYFNLQIESESNATIELSLLDISGRLITKWNTVKDKTIRFGEQLRPGIYIVKIQQGEQLQMLKIIKQ